jgi:hypothetical protein
VGIDDVTHHFLIDRGTADCLLKSLYLEGKIRIYRLGKKYLYQEASFMPPQKMFGKLVEESLKSSSKGWQGI